MGAQTYVIRSSQMAPHTRPPLHRPASMADAGHWGQPGIPPRLGAPRLPVPAPAPTPAVSPDSTLTGRQVAILGSMAQGRDIDGIARELGYSSSTIKKEVHLALKRVGARNRTHAVAMAIRAGII